MSNFYRLEETSSFLSVQFQFFFSAFHWSPSIGKSHMTLVLSSRLRNQTAFHWPLSIGKPPMTPLSFVTTIIRGLPIWMIRGLPSGSLSWIWIEHFTGTDRNGVGVLLPHRTRLCGPYIAVIAGLFYFNCSCVNRHAVVGKCLPVTHHIAEYIFSGSFWTFLSQFENKILIRPVPEDFGTDALHFCT